MSAALERDAVQMAESAGTEASLTDAFEVIAGADRLLVAGVSTRGGTPTVTYDGVALTKAVEAEGGAVSASIWYMVNPPVGTANLVVTPGSTAGIISAALNYRNAKPIVMTETNDPGTVSSLTEAIAARTGCEVLDVICGPDNGSGATPAAGDGQTLLWLNASPGSNGDTRGGGSITEGAPSVTMAWPTLRTENWNHVLAVIEPAVHHGLTTLLMRPIGRV